MPRAVAAIDRLPISGLSEQLLALLPKAVQTAEGWWRVWGFAARAGNVQEYPERPAALRRQYRPPEEVFSEASLATWKGAPVVVLHPQERGEPLPLLSSESVKRLTEGSVFEVRPLPAHNLVMVGMLITGSEAIGHVERADGYRELSAGYLRLQVPEPGLAPDGTEYDAVQRNITINHVALVPEARAGQQARYRGATDASQRGNKENNMEWEEITLPDGRVIRVAKADAGVTRGFVTSANDAQTQLTQAASDSLAAAQRATVAEAKVQALEADLAEFRAQQEQAATDSLRARVTPLLPGVALDGLDSAGLRKKVVGVAYPELSEIFDQAAIDGVFERAAEKLEKAGGKVRTQLNGTGGTDEQTGPGTDSLANERQEIEALRKKRREEEANAWRAQSA
jgi:hypothetical protein